MYVELGLKPSWLFVIDNERAFRERCPENHCMSNSKEPIHGDTTDGSP